MPLPHDTVLTARGGQPVLPPARHAPGGADLDDIAHVMNASDHGQAPQFISITPMPMTRARTF